MASGDMDRLTSTNTFGGNAPHTRDTGFNAFGLLNTGLAFSPEISNIVGFGFGVSTFPGAGKLAFRRLQIGTDFFLFAKTLANAPISEPTSNSTFLGVEPDLYLNWQITSDLTLGASVWSVCPQFGGIFKPRRAAIFLWRADTRFLIGIIHR